MKWNLQNLPTQNLANQTDGVFLFPGEEMRIWEENRSRSRIGRWLYTFPAQCSHWPLFPVELMRAQESLFQLKSDNKKMLVEKDQMVKEAKMLSVRATHHTTKVITQVFMGLINRKTQIKLDWLALGLLYKQCWPLTWPLTANLPPESLKCSQA